MDDLCAVEISADCARLIGGFNRVSPAKSPHSSCHSIVVAVFCVPCRARRHDESHASILSTQSKRIANVRKGIQSIGEDRADCSEG